MYHAQRISPNLAETLQAIENQERQLNRELSGVKVARKRLAALLVKANRARWAAERLAQVIDDNLKMG